MIHVVKHPGYNTGHRMEKTVKKRAVFQKESSERFINGKNAVSVLNSYKFKGHRGSAFHGVFCATGGTESTMAAEGNEFQLSAMRTAVHCTTKSWVATVDHLVDIFHLSVSGMERIFDFLVIIFKDFL